MVRSFLETPADSVGNANVAGGSDDEPTAEAAGTEGDGCASASDLFYEFSVEKISKVVTFQIILSCHGTEGLVYNLLKSSKKKYGLPQTLPLGQWAATRILACPSKLRQRQDPSESLIF
jgi:hypothetical protein